MPDKYFIYHRTLCGGNAIISAFFCAFPAANGEVIPENVQRVISAIITQFRKYVNLENAKTSTTTDFIFDTAFQIKSIDIF